MSKPKVVSISGTEYQKIFGVGKERELETYSPTQKGLYADIVNDVAVKFKLDIINNFGVLIDDFDGNSVSDFVKVVAESLIKQHNLFDLDSRFEIFQALNIPEGETEPRVVNVYILCRDYRLSLVLQSRDLGGNYSFDRLTIDQKEILLPRPIVDINGLRFQIDPVVNYLEPEKLRKPLQVSDIVPDWLEITVPIIDFIKNKMYLNPTGDKRILNPRVAGNVSNYLHDNFLRYYGEGILMIEEPYQDTRPFKPQLLPRIWVDSVTKRRSIQPREEKGPKESLVFLIYVPDPELKEPKDKFPFPLVNNVVMRNIQRKITVSLRDLLGSEAGPGAAAPGLSVEQKEIEQVYDTTNVDIFIDYVTQSFITKFDVTSEDVYHNKITQISRRRTEKERLRKEAELKAFTEAETAKNAARKAKEEKEKEERRAAQEAAEEANKANIAESVERLKEMQKQKETKRKKEAQKTVSFSTAPSVPPVTTGKPGGKKKSVEKLVTGGGKFSALGEGTEE